MKRTLAIALSAVLLGIALTAPTYATEGTVSSTVNRMYYHENHTGLLVILENMSDLGGCGNSHWYVLPKLHTHYKEIVALLTSARVANLPVNVTVRDCAEGYGRISHVMLLP